MSDDFTKEQAEMMKEDFSKAKVKDDGSIVIDSMQGEVKIGQTDVEDPKLPQLKEVIEQTYYNLIHIVDMYCDISEEYKPIVATWIIGTYLHKGFNTYPYLFLNAMRGSGKTRLLKLIASLSANGEIIGSPTEAVLFRIPEGHTLCIDEFEGVLRKGNEGLREMLNACYKKGMKVRRMKRKQVEGETQQVVEEFEPYKPICMANIWGMEEVLGDRCITMILEKSTRGDIMRVMEDFDTNPMVLSIKSAIKANLVYLCSYFGVQGYIQQWNNYVIAKYPTPHTLNTYTTQTTQTTPNISYPKVNINSKTMKFFNRIDETGVNGRNLELFFPLLQIGSFISEDVFTGVLNVVSTLNKVKREDEMTESKDVSLIDFVSKEQRAGEYKSIKMVTMEFRRYVGDVEDSDEKWLNTRWVGRALKRLGLIAEKRRVSRGIEVVLNVDKATKKLEMFK